MFREVGLCVREWVEHYFHCGHAMLMSKTVAVVVRRADVVVSLRWSV